MVHALNYRRPQRKDVSTSSSSQLSYSEKQRSLNDSVKSTAACPLVQGVPEALSFDRIVNGGTCPSAKPVTLRDFMNYLKYIEHDAENLQFFLWARAYIKKFNELPESERKLSPEWTQEQQEADGLGQAPARPVKVSPDTAAALKGTGLETAPKITEILDEKNSSNSSSLPQSIGNGFPYTVLSDVGSAHGSLDWPSVAQSSGTTSEQFRRKAEGAFDDAGLKWQPFTIQPYRDEVARIIAIYVSDGAPRQLNLSSKERNTLLHALENTTHPSALLEVLTTVEWSLRFQSHPNFIRWTICNGNRPRVVFARGLGIFGIVGGIVFGILMTLSNASRAWRVFALLLFFIGISTLIAAIKGMCVVLHGMHHRHLRPWELFSDEDDTSVEIKNVSYDSLESTSTNSYEDEPWVAKYKKRNVIRKIFDRELWVQEPALRQIQDTIFLQAVLGGLVGGAILTAIFVAVPAGRFY